VGIPSGSGDFKEKLRRRKRVLMLRHHPNKRGDSQKLIQIRTAINIIKDKNVRDYYDSFLKNLCRRTLDGEEENIYELHEDKRSDGKVAEASGDMD
jgi:DnaJ-class molecular chaperone